MPDRLCTIREVRRGFQLRTRVTPKKIRRDPNFKAVSGGTAELVKSIPTPPPDSGHLDQPPYLCDKLAMM